MSARIIGSGFQLLRELELALTEGARAIEDISMGKFRSREDPWEMEGFSLKALTGRRDGEEGGGRDAKSLSLLLLLLLFLFLFFFFSFLVLGQGLALSYFSNC